MPTKKSPSTKKNTTKPAIISSPKNKEVQSSILSGVAYITVIGWLIAYFSAPSEKTEDEQFHIRQSFGLHMTMLVLEILGTFSMIPYFLINFIWLLYSIALIVFAIQGWRGKKSKIGLLGDKFQEWFSFL